MFFIVLYSGGLDSTFLVFILKKLGIKIICYYIKICLLNNNRSNLDYSNCCIISSFLSFKLRFIDYSYLYNRYVFRSFLNDYSKGNTPNPDIFCNSKLKFWIFLKLCFLSFKSSNVIFFSGHYARKKNNHIYISKDFIKDQTYFLCNVFSFRNIFFLIGNYYKYEVKSYLNYLCLINLTNPSSRGICFLHINYFSKFISRYCFKKVSIFDSCLNFIFFSYKSYHLTIGQKLNLPISNKRYYLYKKHTNAIFVTCNKNSIHMFSKRYLLIDSYFRTSIYFPCIYYCKISSVSLLIKCYLNFIGNSFYVHFIYPSRSIASGQYISFYFLGKCIGGSKVK